MMGPACAPLRGSPTRFKEQLLLCLTAVVVLESGFGVSDPTGVALRLPSATKVASHVSRTVTPTLWSVIPYGSKMLHRVLLLAIIATAGAVGVACSSSQTEAKPSVTTGGHPPAANACVLLGAEGAAALTGDSTLTVRGQLITIADGEGASSPVYGADAYSQTTPNHNDEAPGPSFGSGVDGTVAFCSWSAADQVPRVGVWYARTTDVDAIRAQMSTTPPAAGCPEGTEGFAFTDDTLHGTDVLVHTCVYELAGNDGSGITVALTIPDSASRSAIDDAVRTVLGRV